MKIIVNNKYNRKIWMLLRYLNKQKQATIPGQQNYADLLQLISYLKHNWKNRNRKAKHYIWTKDLVVALSQSLFFEEPIYIISAGDEKDIYGKPLNIKDWKTHLAKLKYREGFERIKISYLSAHLLSLETIEKLQQIDNELSRWRTRDYTIFKLKYLWTLVFPNKNLNAQQVANLLPISAEEVEISNQNFRQNDLLYPVTSNAHFSLLTYYDINENFLINSEEHHDPKWFINEVSKLHNSRKNFEKKHKAYMPTLGTVIVHLEEFAIFEHKLHQIKGTTLYPARVYKYDLNGVWSFKDVKSYIVDNPSYHGQWEEDFTSSINMYEFHKYFIYQDEVNQLKTINNIINEEDKYDQLMNLFITLIINVLNKTFRPMFYFKKDVFGKRITFRKYRREYTIKIVTDFTGADLLYRNHSQNFEARKTEHTFYCKTIWPIYDTMQVFKRFCLKVIKNI